MSPVLFVTFAVVSLWDFYIPSAGGKVLDYVGLTILVLSLMPRVALGDWRPLALTSSHFLLLLTMSPLIALGVVRGGLLTAAAFVTGCVFVFAIFFRKDFDQDLLYRQIGWLPGDPLRLAIQ